SRRHTHGRRSGRQQPPCWYWWHEQRFARAQRRGDFGNDKVEPEGRRARRKPGRGYTLLQTLPLRKCIHPGGHPVLQAGLQRRFWCRRAGRV
ncbi:unnamed protein product, partial [Amoebophrya sp. A120]